MSEVKFDGIELQKKAPPAISRRDFLKGLGALAGLAVGGALVPNAVRYVLEGLSASTEDLYGAFLVEKADDKYEISQAPTVEEVEFTSGSDANNPDKVLFRQGKPIKSAQEILVTPKDIKSKYAVKVFGQGFGGNSLYSSKDLDYKGENRHFGVWFMLSDEHGRPIDKNGKVLGIRDADKIIYTSANSVTVIPQTNPQPSAKK